MKEKILILQRIIPHYRTGFFEKFKKNFSNTKIVYGQPHKTEPLHNSENLKGDLFIKIKNYYFGKSEKIFFSDIYSIVFNYRPDVIISVFNVGNLNIYILYVLKFIVGYKLILWSFGYDPFEGFHPENKFKDKVRLFLSQKADAVIFYWDKGKETVSKFSERTEHYFVAPNTLDTEKQFNLKDRFDKKGKEKIKEELGINEKYHFVYTGRLLDIKQVDLLLKAFERIEKKNIDCRLTIIGDGPVTDKLKNLSAELGLKKTDFKGEILDEEITGKWIYISDAFVMPGRLGLSVVHSFCFGTPVISMNKESDFHSEGIGYLKDGENGFLTEDGNINELAQRMTEIIMNPDLSGRLRENVFETVKNCASSENMFGGFQKAIEYVIGNQKKINNKS